ncbi:helix-turn-helix domain-containing protein [Nocardia sp. NPDC058640]|uniref:helix-turn-helix domain-containing protein n=1 Tax=Nocardia sp. NPDC058640 TaxID=3346571 RepID=UPI00364D3AA3
MIVGRWTAAHIRALRVDALRESQPAFAQRLGFEAVTVRKWESRATEAKPVRGASAAALDTQLARLTADQLHRMELALVALDPESEDDVNRRQFGIATTMSAVSLVGPATDRGPTVDHPRIGLSEVRAWIEYTEELEQRDQREGGARLVQAASSALTRARREVDVAHCDPATGAAAASAVGNLAVTTGWLAYDADQHDLARACYRTALEMSMRSGDEELAVHALLNAANQEIALSRQAIGNPHLALQNASRAERLAQHWNPGRVHALIAVRQAQAWGHIGNHDGFRTAMNTAHASMDTALDSEILGRCPSWLRFVDPPELAGHEARAHSDLGDYRTALTHYERALQGQSVRNEANTRAWHAATLAAVGDTRGALAAGQSVLDSLGTIGSTRTLRAMAPIRALHAAKHSGFADHYDQLDRQALPA